MSLPCPVCRGSGASGQWAVCLHVINTARIAVGSRADCERFLRSLPDLGDFGGDYYAKVHTQEDPFIEPLACSNCEGTGRVPKY